MGYGGGGGCFGWWDRGDCREDCRRCDGEIFPVRWSGDLIEDYLDVHILSSINRVIQWTWSAPR